MPMRNETRSQRANALIERLKRGPATFRDSHDKEVYLRWVSSWIVPEVETLVPELQRKNKAMKEGFQDEAFKLWPKNRFRRIKYVEARVDGFEEARAKQIAEGGI